jgi:hypothetical protein
MNIKAFQINIRRSIRQRLICARTYFPYHGVDPLVFYTPSPRRRFDPFSGVSTPFPLRTLISSRLPRRAAPIHIRITTPLIPHTGPTAFHGAGVIRGGGDGPSEFRSGLAAALTAASAAPFSIPGLRASALVIPAFSIPGSGASALVTAAFFIPGSGASALPMRALVEVFAATAADSVRQVCPTREPGQRTSRNTQASAVRSAGMVCAIAAGKSTLSPWRPERSPAFGRIIHG